MMHLESGLIFAIFVIAAILVGAALRSILNKRFLPYSVALLTLGLSGGLVLRSLSQDNPEMAVGLEVITSIDPHLLLFMFLPTLIFESAFAMESHLFKRIFSQIALLAVPGLLLAVIGTATLVYFVFPLEWSWGLCLLFGALISATDPVAVVALLKEVSSRKRLETLIEGESLLNDGTAIVLFTLFAALLSSGGEFSLSDSAIEFFRVVISGLLLGIIVGYFALLWIEKVFNNPLVEIGISIATAYLVYFLAESLLHVSGVVAVVAMAIIFAGPGRTRISVQTADFLHVIWEMMAYIANTLIFLLVGLIVALKVRLDLIEWWGMLLGLYIGILTIRGVAIACLLPILSRIGIGITKEKAVVLTWGGLRGAVSLALALTLVDHPAISAAVGEQILFMTAGIVVLTILINGSTMGWVLRLLGLSGLPKPKQATVNKAKAQLAKALEKQITLLKKDPLMQRADWDKISGRLPVILTDDALVDAPVTEAEQSVAYQRRLLETERQFYWKQYRSGGLERIAVNKLVDGVDRALDGEPSIGPREALFKYWKPPLLATALGRYRWLNRWSLSLSFNQMALGYEVARGYILAQNQILILAPQLAPNSALAELVCRQIAKNKIGVLQMMGQLQERFPEVAYSLETQTASRLLHNRERFLIKQMVIDAQLEQAEAQKMLESVELKLRSLRKMPRFTTPSDYFTILSKVPWLQAVKPCSLTSLSHHAWRRIHSQGELLQKKGELADAVAILCRGNIRGHKPLKAGTVQCLGLEALITGHFQQDLYSDGPCDIVWLDLNALRNIAGEDPELAELLSIETQHQLAQSHPS